MTNKILASALLAGAFVLSAFSPASAKGDRNPSAPRHMTLNSGQSTATDATRPPDGSLDSGTRIAIQLQDNHHGEGGN